MNDIAIRVSNADVFLGRKQILYNINMSVKKGQHSFVLGANGAGKTTLTRMLLGYLWPKYGSEIEVLGNIYGQCDIFEVRKKISWISPYLSNWVSSELWTVREIILSGKDSTIGLYRKTTTEEENHTDEILEILGLSSYKNRCYRELSSGEQVKVLIGKALFSKSKIMILDEACVHLDIKSREMFLETIEELADSQDSPTIFFVTQRMEDIISVFNSGFMMKNGKIIVSGRKNDILTENNLQNVFEMPMKLVYSENGRIWPVVQGN